MRSKNTTKQIADTKLVKGSWAKNYRFINLNTCTLFTGSAVEALCSVLEKNNFGNSFGRYSARVASYERSIYLESLNGKATFKRDLKKEKTRIDSPRLNICLLRHTQFLLK